MTKKALISPLEVIAGDPGGYRVAEVRSTVFSVAPPLFWVDCADDITTNHYYKDHNFYPITPPDPGVPRKVSRAQGKAALIQAGLWGSVLSFVAGISDPTQKAFAEIAINDTQDWERNSPFLAQAAQALGLSEQQLDDLFTVAAQIKF